jgi:hypothetical protein
MKVTGFKFSPPKNKLHKKYKVMKITGYLTQCCNQIRNESEVYGILSVPNMFSKFDSLKTVPPEQSTKHFCNECYQLQVIKQADILVNKKYNFEAWTNKTKELAFIFKQSCMNNKVTKIVNEEQGLMNNELQPDNQEKQPKTKKFRDFGRNNKD